MDERLATEGILEIAMVQATEAGADRITEVHIAVGDLLGFEAASVRSHWEEISRGTIAEHAKLNVRRIPAELQCMACFTPYIPPEGEIHCSVCGGSGAKILAGEDFYLESLQFE